MKTKFLLIMISLSLVAGGFKMLPCIVSSMSHDCCQPVSNLTLSNSISKCCDGKIGASSPSDLALNVSKFSSLGLAPVQNLVAFFSMPSLQSVPKFSWLEGNLKGNIPKVPTYLDHVQLLL